MQYLILIHLDGSAWPSMTPEQQAEGMRIYMAYTQALRDGGHLVQSSRLHPAAQAKQITFEGDKRRVVDGPYTDTKEQIGGFYLIEAADDAEALRLASECPGARHGRVELRQLAVM